MLCKRCEPQTGSEPTRPRLVERRRAARCDRCGAAILTLAGVPVGVGDDILVQLGRFGLVPLGKPLLEPKRGKA